MQVKLFFCHF